MFYSYLLFNLLSHFVRHPARRVQGHSSGKTGETAPQQREAHTHVITGNRLIGCGLGLNQGGRQSASKDRQHSNEVGESFVISQPRPNLIRQPFLSPHTIPLTGCRIVSRTIPRYIAILATLAVNLSRACLASGRESASPAAAVIDRRAFMLPLRHPRAPHRHRIRHSVYP